MDAAAAFAAQLEGLADDCFESHNSAKQSISFGLSEFHIVRAETRDLIETCFRLRYQVYCVENQFEPRIQPIPGLETDENDARSIHSLLFHGPTGKAVGTVRIILPAVGHSEQPLPMLRPRRDGGSADPAPLPIALTGEISRFAVSRLARREIARAQGALVSADRRAAVYREESDRRPFTRVVLLLMRAMLEMSNNHGITHLCAVMEPSLIRLLSRFAVHFTPIGQLVEHHGLRQPCYARIAALLERTKVKRPDVWSVLTDNGRLRPVSVDLAA